MPNSRNSFCTLKEMLPLTYWEPCILPSITVSSEKEEVVTKMFTLFEFPDYIVRNTTNFKSDDLQII